MAATTALIKVTPMLGGCTEGGVCSLLEVGGSRILLDCGCTSTTTIEELQNVIKILANDGGVDAVLLSHADLQHMGALPSIFGKDGLGVVPVICTVPVHKFGQMLLYDLYLNKEMEGIDELLTSSTQQKTFDLDDIDSVLNNISVTNVRYSQTINLGDVITTMNRNSPISVCAYPSGRTIGGSIWSIRHGATEVLYTMDVNLKREILLDGSPLEMIPTSPALMIVEGCCANRGLTSGGRSIRKKEKDEVATLINSVMESLRFNGGGNVLIPCETAGRVLELFQILGKHWIDNKMDMYHLIFLSHMSYNTIEFARSQLEWMSETLSKGFYNGKPNPFELPPLKLVNSVRELEKKYPGPKVVFATDSSLTYGLSKELLLRWGGDPRCKVIFTDESDNGSVASDIRKPRPDGVPIVATLTKPQRRELQGEELADKIKEMELKQRLKEESELRQRRQEELLLLAADRPDDLVSDDEEEIEDVSSKIIINNSIGSNDSKRKKLNNGGIEKNKIGTFAESNFPMFESKSILLTHDDYGGTIDDLNFHDLTSSAVLRHAKNVANASARLVAYGGKDVQDQELGILGKLSAIAEANEEFDNSTSNIQNGIPWKLVAVAMKTQFTCTLQDISIGGRADFKAIKTLISKVCPARIIVLRGNKEDCEKVSNYATNSGFESFFPNNNEEISFQVVAARIQLKVPKLRPEYLRTIRGSLIENVGVNSSYQDNSNCIVSVLSGKLSESNEGIVSDGIRIVQLQDDEEELNVEEEVDEEEEEEIVEKDGVMEDEDENNDDEDEDTHLLRTDKDYKSEQVDDIEDFDTSCLSSTVGLISVGEVNLNRLKHLIEQRGTGITVEYRLGANGGMLVLGGQVLIRKENDNDFIVEGPPVPAFFEARKVLYQQFTYFQ
jgi:cleavage and polyadenylation specificity factor subunit 2